MVKSLMFFYFLLYCILHQLPILEPWSQNMGFLLLNGEKNKGVSLTIGRIDIFYQPFI